MNQFAKGVIRNFTAVILCACFSGLAMAADGYSVAMKWTQNSVFGAYYAIELLESQSDGSRHIQVSLHGTGSEIIKFVYAVTKVEKNDLGVATLWSGEISKRFRPGAMVIVNTKDQSVLTVTSTTPDFDFNDGINRIGWGTHNWSYHPPALDCAHLVDNLFRPLQ